MKKTARHTEKTLVTPVQFAKKRGITRATIYRHILSGKIKVTTVGMHKDEYIDWSDYKDYEFAENMKRN